MITYDILLPKKRPIGFAAGLPFVLILKFNYYQYTRSSLLNLFENIQKLEKIFYSRPDILRGIVLFLF